MEFKFKDEDKMTEDEAVENEAAETRASEQEFTGQEELENRVEETDPFEPVVDQSEATEIEPEETYAADSDDVEDDSMEDEGPGLQVGGGGTVQGEPTATRPKYRIPLDHEETKRPFSLPIKQIVLVIFLLGGGYYVKTYHGKENKPTRIDNPPVVGTQAPAPKVSSIEELSGILNESKELLKSREEDARRLRNRASARGAPRSVRSKPINFQALKSYQGQWVTLRMKDGMEQEGRISDVNEQIVHLEQDYEYGTISVRVPIQSIADVRK